MEAKLIVLRGKAKGREIPLPAGQFIIGRGSSCHLRPHSEQVSKVHCAIGRKAGNRLVVRDLKSRNKTYINDEPITGTVQVFDGDLLKVGPLQFQFVINAGVPHADLHADHVLWLMDKSADSFDVESSAETAVIEIPPELLAQNADQDSENGHICTENQTDGVNEGLSAGQYLRDHVRQIAAAPAITATDLPQTVQLNKNHVAFVDRLIAEMSKDVRVFPPTRDDVVASLIDAVAGWNLDLTTINSLKQLKAAIAAKRP